MCCNLFTRNTILTTGSSRPPSRKPTPTSAGSSVIGNSEWDSDSVVVEEGTVLQTLVGGGRPRTLKVQSQFKVLKDESFCCNIAGIASDT